MQFCTEAIGSLLEKANIPTPSPNLQKNIVGFVPYNFPSSYNPPTISAAFAKLYAFDYAVQHYQMGNATLCKTVQVLVEFVEAENSPFKGMKLPPRIEAGVEAAREVLIK